MCIKMHCTCTRFDVNDNERLQKYCKTVHLSPIHFYMQNSSLDILLHLCSMEERHFGSRDRKLWQNFRRIIHLTDVWTLNSFFFIYIDYIHKILLWTGLTKYTLGALHTASVQPVYICWQGVGGIRKTLPVHPQHFNCASTANGTNDFDPGCQIPQQWTQTAVLVAKTFVGQIQVRAAQFWINW